MNDPHGFIFDIRRFSIHDGPGIRTTVFFKGCPLSCRWCHNPESQGEGRAVMFRETRCMGCGECLAACPEGAILWLEDMPATDLLRCEVCGGCVEICPTGARELVGRNWDVAEVMAALRRDTPFYDESGGGVTLSGGEPLHQPGFTKVLLQACKGEDIHTALDTCGYASWETLDEIRPYVDLFLYDIKIMDERLHTQYTGISNRLILENLIRLARLGHKIILRVPLIHGITDGEENITAIAELARSLPGIQRIDLLPYHDAARLKYHRLGREYEILGTLSVDAERVTSLAGLVQAHQIETRIGG